MIEEYFHSADELPLEERSATIDQPDCTAEKHGFTCTLPHGHTGKHIAHGTDNGSLVRWE